MRTGYREMLRDRLPKVVDMALRYNKAKERWLDHVYYSFIWIYSDNEERYKATKVILGNNKKKKFFDFHKTIDWDNLPKDDNFVQNTDGSYMSQYKYWEIIESQVNWFKEHMMFIENAYDLYYNQGYSTESILEFIKLQYLKEFDQSEQDNLIRFLAKELSGN